MDLSWSELVQYHPKQLQACEAADSHTYTLYGGSRGPGKSYWLRWYLLERLLRWFGEGHRGVRVSLFCEDYPTLTDRQITKIETEFPDWLGKVKTSRQHGLGFHLHEGYGSGVLCLRNLDKAEKYQSAEFAGIGVDELTKNKKNTFDMLRGSMRWPGVEDVFFAGATNPGDIGHLWVKDLWVDRVYPPELQDLADQFVYVAALPDDNPHLLPAYWKMLESLPPDLARAWRWGDWDVFEGQVFSEWRRDVHVIKPHKVPDHWIRWRAVDWGFASPWAVLWLARDPDSDYTLVYREHYEGNVTDPDQAERILAKTSDKEDIRYTLADPSMWTQRSLERQTVSTADVYRKNGVQLKKADNDRIGGWRRIHEALQVDKRGEPQLRVFSTCTNLIRTLPALPYDGTKVEDVDTDSEDHAADALRYGMSWKVLKKRRAPNTVEDLWRAAR